MKKSKVTITEKALVQRVSRKLKQQANQESLHAARTKKQAQEFGRYFMVENGTAVGRTHVDLEKFASQLGVLHAWEELDDRP